MKKAIIKPDSKYLREKAGELLKNKPVKTTSPNSEADILKLIQTLEVYHVELKLQNEELLLAEEAGKMADEYRKIGWEIIKILNKFGELQDSIQQVVNILKTRTGFDAVGIRMQDGDDYPYLAQNGFSYDFMLTENTLVERTAGGGICHDKDGNVCLECSCGLIISGKTDPSNPLFTKGGSAWTNDSLPFLQTPPGDDPRYHPRNQCFHQGYASVALIPIRNRENVVGLIQLNDHRKGCFTLQTIELLEGISAHIGEALMRKQVEDSLRKHEEYFRSIFENNSAAIAIIEPDSTISMVNDEYCRMGGYLRQEVIGTSWIQQIPPEDLERLKEYNRRRMINPSDAPDKYEFSFYKKNGEIGHAFMSVTILSNRKLIASFVDFSERKKADAELRLKGEILENMEEGVFLISAADWSIVYANPKVECMFGYGAREILGKNINVLNAPTESWHEEKVKDIVRELNDNGVWKGEVQNARKDGTLFWNLVNISIFEHFQFGKVWISILQDITDRKLAEQAMEISDEKYRTMLNSSPDGIILIDMKWIITEVSEIGLELFGAERRSDLVGKNFLTFVPFDEHQTMKKIIEKTTTEGLLQNIGLKIKKKNQTVFSGELSTTLIQGPDGAPRSYMIIIRDISQRKKLETQQSHADRMANLGEMASGIAHEINQPLNIISMVMDKILFESAKTDSINIEFLRNKSDKIFENITRIRNIIDHIRAFSRSHDDYVLSTFNINSSIENATSMISEQFKYLGIKLDLQLEKDIPQLFGNSIKFEQVIVNLLLNAKDAVIDNKGKEDGYVEMIVGIRSYKELHFLVVEVTDNGVGISNVDINNIMLPFYTTKDEGKGTGLGLSICYQIIKEMNGTIEITSDRLQGTKIKLVLDIQKQNKDGSTR